MCFNIQCNFKYNNRTANTLVLCKAILFEILEISKMNSIITKKCSLLIYFILWQIWAYKYQIDIKCGLTDWKGAIWPYLIPQKFSVHPDHIQLVGNRQIRWGSWNMMQSIEIRNDFCYKPNQGRKQDSHNQIRKWKIQSLSLLS